MTRHPFTLLEVIIALLILSIGIFSLMGQLALAARRNSDAVRDWRDTHELVNAAEYTLLAGPAARLDERFLDRKNYRVKRRYQPAALPDGFEHPVNGMQLVTLTLTLCNPDGKELDRLAVECWKESNVHAPDE